MVYKKMTPRSGEILKILKFGRVSTEHQNTSNIAASYQYLEPIANSLYDGRCEIQELGEQGSGMLTERKTILAAYALIENRQIDVVLLEDVSKSYRNPRWIYAFVQDCYEYGVRVIAPGDSLDTYEDNWEIVLGAAAFRHGMHIPDTRRRVRRTAAHSFSNGGMVFKVRFGYRKLTREEAALGQFGPKGLRIAKIPEATEVIQTLRRMVVINRAGGSVLAKWLKDKGIATGPHIKNGLWTGRVVLDLLRDEILHGKRQYPKVQHHPRFSDGKHDRKKNPAPAENIYAELAHMSEAEFDEMQLVLDEIGGLGSGKPRPSGEMHARFRVRRCDAITPLQHATCNICGSLMYPCGKDVAKCMLSLGRHNVTCWNHVQINLPLVRERLVDLLLARMTLSSQAMDAFYNAVFEHVKILQRGSGSSIENIDQEILTFEKQAERIVDAIADAGGSATLTAKLKAIEKSLKDARKRRQEQFDHAPVSLPLTQEQLRIDPQPVLLELASTSFEFGQLLRKIFPVFEIQPVQYLDCGLVRPRAFLTLNLGALQSPETNPADRAPAEEIVVDLFESNVHIRHLAAVVELQAAKLITGQKVTLDILAEELGIGRMTVRRALDYHRLMQQQGTTDPYRVLVEKPESASRWKPRAANVSTSVIAAASIPTHEVLPMPTDPPIPAAEAPLTSPQGSSTPSP